MDENKKEILSVSRIDDAIDGMDLERIEDFIEGLEDCDELESSMEESALFARRIIRDKRGGRKMNGRKNSGMRRFGLVASCALAFVAVGITAYAGGLFEKFDFYNDTNTVQIRTNQELSEEEAAQMAKEASQDYESGEVDENAYVPEEVTYSTIDEAVEKTGVDIAVPSVLPSGVFIKEEIMAYETGADNQNIYVMYSSEDEKKLFGITVITQNMTENSTVVCVTDAVHRTTYTTPSGDKYEILDEDGGIIASTSVGSIEYALVFMGVSEEEIHKVIDSADLSIYSK